MNLSGQVHNGSSSVGHSRQRGRILVTECGAKQCSGRIPSAPRRRGASSPHLTAGVQQGSGRGEAANAAADKDHALVQGHWAAGTLQKCARLFAIRWSWLLCHRC